VTYTYRAYGLVIRVPFACPSLVPCVDEPDVTVREAAVPRRLDGAPMSDPSFDAAPGQFLFRGGAQGGRFLVQGGAVTLERNGQANDATLARQFTDRILAAVLFHRGFLVLHADALVAPDGTAIVVAGESGAGKSTTLAAVLDQGATMLSDDVTVLGGDGEGRVQVLPGAAQLHLTKDAVEGLGYEIEPGQLQPWRRMKAAIATHAGMAERPVRLAALYVLETWPEEYVATNMLAGRRKFEALQACMYGPMFADEHLGVLPVMSALMDHVVFWRLYRPQRGWSVADVVTEILGAARSPTP